MSYYGEVKKANKLIDDEINLVLSGAEKNLSALILEVTAKFEVGEGVVLKRVKRIKLVNSDLMIDEEGKMFLRV